MLFNPITQKIAFFETVLQKLVLFAVGLIIGATLNAQILPTFGDSRSGSTGMQFLKIAPDARSLGLGNAHVATTDDVAAMFWNPAGITQTDTAKVNVMVSNGRYFGDITSNYAGVVSKIGKRSFLGFQVFSMNYGQMKETNEFEPNGTGRTFTVNNFHLGLTYAQVLTSNFSFGLNARYANESYPGVSVNNILFDLGLKYDIGLKGAKFGVSFSNFGLNVSPNGEVQVLKFTGPTDITNFTTVTVPGIFRLGAAFNPIQKNKHLLTLAAQLNHPTDNNETYNIGAEYAYKNTIYGRTGYEFASDEAYIAPALGAGFKFKRNFGGFIIDYGFLAKNRLGNIHRLTLAVHIK